MKIKLITQLFSLVLLISLFACQKQADTSDQYFCPMKCEGHKTYDHPGTCPVCKMDLIKVSAVETPVLDEDGISDRSIFNLTSEWKTQNNKTIQLTDLKGKVMVVVMIYTSCEAACPRLVADMRNINEKVANPAIDFVLVSIDPGRDTPEVLKAYAKEEHLEGDQWTLLQGTVDDVREFSNVLSMKYKKISPIDFSHTNIISVFDKNGVLQYQQEGLGVSNDKLVAEVKRLSK
ncbi:SCO family protein [Algoriphagus sp. C2-6-M1]|uniref:SCO family protein n=1 Tax=Algoriphagus persicinus TaxID=3108754 RepID=UPI002B38FC34|nr:SCO family protein [Algoriphagus sp. C2-6-M1]MEB2781731.1 SCO family protein [Algoriphagus sp. C2-6-M1]